MTLKHRVNERLGNIREERKMTQAEFADLLGVSAPAYGRLERGETTADLDSLIRFSEVLGVPFTEFLPNYLPRNNRNSVGAGVVFGNHITNLYIVNCHTQPEDGLTTKLEELASRLEKRATNHNR